MRRVASACSSEARNSALRLPLIGVFRDLPLR